MPGVSGDVCDDSLVIFLCKDISGNPIKQVSCSLHTMALCTMIIEELFSCGEVGMIMLNDALMDLVDQKIVEPREAYLKASDKPSLVTQLKQRNHTVAFLDEG